MNLGIRFAAIELLKILACTIRVHQSLPHAFEEIRKLMNAGGKEVDPHFEAGSHEAHRPFVRECGWDLEYLGIPDVVALNCDILVRRTRPAPCGLIINVVCDQPQNEPPERLQVVLGVVRYITPVSGVNCTCGSLIRTIRRRVSLLRVHYHVQNVIAS